MEIRYLFQSWKRVLLPRPPVLCPPDHLMSGVSWGLFSVQSVQWRPPLGCGCGGAELLLGQGAPCKKFPSASVTFFFWLHPEV